MRQRPALQWWTRSARRVRLSPLSFFLTLVCLSLSIYLSLSLSLSIYLSIYQSINLSVCVCVVASCAVLELSSTVHRRVEWSAWTVLHRTAGSTPSLCWYGAYCTCALHCTTEHLVLRDVCVCVCVCACVTCGLLHCGQSSGPVDDSERCRVFCGQKWRMNTMSGITSHTRNEKAHKKPRAVKPCNERH